MRGAQKTGAAIGRWCAGKLLSAYHIQYAYLLYTLYLFYLYYDFEKND